MGSKRQKAPGVWELRVYVGRRDGRDVQKSVTWPPKGRDGKRPKGSARGADAALRDLVAKLEAGDFDPPPTDTVREVVEMWLTDHATHWAPRTAAENRLFMDRYVLPRIGERVAVTVKPRELAAMYRDIAAEVAERSKDKDGVPRRTGEVTARRAHTLLSGAFNHAVRSGEAELSRNPCTLVKPPRATAGAEPSATLGTVAALIRQAEKDANAFMGTLVRAAVATGARRSELGALRWSDLDLDAGTVTIGRALTAVDGEVLVKGTKTGVVKHLALDAGTVAVLRAWRAESDRQYTLAGMTMAPAWFVWGGPEPMHPDALSGRFRKLTGRAKVQCRFHDIRHVTGSFMVSAGVGPSEAAARQGHSEAVLLGTYAHADPSKDRAVADMIGAAVDAELAP